MAGQQTNRKAWKRGRRQLPTNGNGAVPELDGGAAHLYGLEPAGLARHPLLGLHLRTPRY